MGDNYYSGACRLDCNRVLKCLSGKKPVEGEDKHKEDGEGVVSATVITLNTQPGAITEQLSHAPCNRMPSNSHAYISLITS